MSILDAIFQRAPGIVARGMKGAREGREYQDTIKRQAMMDSLAQRRIGVGEEGNDIRYKLGEMKNAIDAIRAGNDTTRTGVYATTLPIRADAAKRQADTAAVKADQEPSVVINEEGGQKLVGGRSGKDIRQFGPRPQPPVQPVLMAGQDPDTHEPTVFRIDRRQGSAVAVPGIAPKPSASTDAFRRKLDQMDAVIETSRGQIRNAHNTLKKAEEMGTVPSDGEISVALKHPNFSNWLQSQPGNSWFGGLRELASLQAAARGQRGLGAIENITRALAQSRDQRLGAIEDADSAFARIDRRATGKDRRITGEESPKPERPVRKPGESDDDFFKRLAAWKP